MLETIYLQRLNVDVRSSIDAFFSRFWCPVYTYAKQQKKLEKKKRKNQKTEKKYYVPVTFSPSDLEEEEEKEDEEEQIRNASKKRRKAQKKERIIVHSPLFASFFFFCRILRAPRFPQLDLFLTVSRIELLHLTPPINPKQRFSPPLDVQESVV